MDADLPALPPVDEAALTEIVGASTTWRFDEAFLRSRWTCIWGAGCLGILAEPSEDLAQGCCSLGAELDSDDEARTLSAMAAMIPADRFAHAARVDDPDQFGVFRDGDRRATRVVDGACIFFNPPDFAGGAGCALHLAALDHDDPPAEWKPSVCSQLPIRVDWTDDPDDPEREIATLRRWTRTDWGAQGTTMAWCCTEGSRAYVGDLPVHESLADVLSDVVDPDVHDALRAVLSRDP